MDVDTPRILVKKAIVKGDFALFVEYRPTVRHPLRYSSKGLRWRLLRIFLTDQRRGQSRLRALRFLTAADARRAGKPYNRRTVIGLRKGGTVADRTLFEMVPVELIQLHKIVCGMTEASSIGIAHPVNINTTR